MSGKLAQWHLPPWKPQESSWVRLDIFKLTQWVTCPSSPLGVHIDHMASDQAQPAAPWCSLPLDKPVAMAGKDNLSVIPEPTTQGPASWQLCWPCLRLITQARDVADSQNTGKHLNLLILRVLLPGRTAVKGGTPTISPSALPEGDLRPCSWGERSACCHPSKSQEARGGLMVTFLSSWSPKFPATSPQS